jgi:hypothetical protein
MTVKRLRRGFDQHLTVGQQPSKGISSLKCEGLGRTTVPRHLRRIDPRKANRFAGVQNQRITINEFGDLTEPPFGLGSRLCRAKEKKAPQHDPDPDGPAF